MSVCHRLGGGERETISVEVGLRLILKRNYCLKAMQTRLFKAKHFDIQMPRGEETETSGQVKYGSTAIIHRSNSEKLLRKKI